jgi:Extensin-like protein C-terminus
MGGGVRWYLVGSLVLVMLAGCGRGFMFEEREPWRHDAEVACLKSGSVRESAGLVRIAPIEGPGICGADFPLRVAMIGGHAAELGFGDPPRPPGAIPGASQPPWPITQPRISVPPPSATPAPYVPPAQPLGPPLDLTLTDQPPGRAPPAYPPPQPQSVPLASPQYTGAVGPVEIKPAATLACPIVSALDQWIAQSVQPTARRWFGQPVVDIKQISAYSCRGMNGQPGAKISEHAFGNALDIAAFVLADGRVVKVKDGWRGRPEEQGFLRDVHSTACEQFTTVLAPGSNEFHYDHIHVDLMRRANGRRICEPAAVDGETVAARAQQRNPTPPPLQNRPQYTPVPGVPPPVPRNTPIDERNDPYAWRGAAKKSDDALVTGSTGPQSKTPKAPAEFDWIEEDGPRAAVK